MLQRANEGQPLDANQGEIGVKRSLEVDESVETLLQKLKQKGKRVRVLEEGESSPLAGRPGSETGRSGFESSKRLPAGFLQTNGESLIMPSPIPKQGKLDKLEKLEKRPSLEAEPSPKGPEIRREEDRDKMQQELGEKRQALETSEAEKLSLLRMIQELEKKVVVGGHVLDEQERDHIIKQREIGL